MLPTRSAPLRLVLLFAILAPLTGCQLVPDAAELDRLRRENDELRQALDSMVRDAPDARTPIREFTVGLAAAEENFDDQAFLDLLTTNLRNNAVEGASFKVVAETRPEQVAKVRGMLVQENLSGEKQAVKITDLTFRLSSSSDQFMIGGIGIPLEEARALGGNRYTFDGPIIATMERTGAETFSIEFQESGGSSGRATIDIRELDIFADTPPVQTVRAGDVSFNWQLSLEKIKVYRVQDYLGDGGKFLLQMRYPTQESDFARYQSNQSIVYLLVYGPYVSLAIQQILTPDEIDRVEVVALDASVAGALRPGMRDAELSDAIKPLAASWQECKLDGRTGDQKRWNRPPGINLPFLSRQVSRSRGVVFYYQYTDAGAVLILDTPLAGR